MSTKTKNKPTQAAKTKTEILARSDYHRTDEVSVAAIDPSPYQPRQAISDESLQPLAEAIKQAGFVDAIWVRPTADRYELLDGERRWRAAKMAGLDSIRADVFRCTDAQARQMALLSVLHREDLTPMERATAYDKMLKAGDYPEQQALAAAMGVDPSTVSHLLKLLTLPADWQQRLANGRMTERHARALMPYAARPAVLEQIAANIEKDDDMPNVQYWERVIIPGAVADATRPMNTPGRPDTAMHYDPHYGRVTIFDPTPLEEKQLDLITIDGEERACNTELWDSLQSAHMERLSAERAEAQNSPYASDESEAEQELEAATQSAAAEDGTIVIGEPPPDAQREKPREKPPAAKKPRDPADFYRWKLAWIRKLIADELPQGTLQDLTKLLMLGMSCWRTDNETQEQNLDEAVRQRLAGSRKKSLTASLLEDLADVDLENVLAEYLQTWFWSDREGPLAVVPPEDCETIARFMKISLPGEWARGNVLAPRALLDLYDADGLRRLAMAWRIDPGQAPDKLKSALEGEITENGEHCKLPAEITKAQRA